MENKIKEARIKSGLSQRAMSEAFGIPQKTIEGWDMGVRNCPSYVEESILEKFKKNYSTLTKATSERLTRVLAKRFETGSEIVVSTYNNLFVKDGLTIKCNENVSSVRLGEITRAVGSSKFHLDIRFNKSEQMLLIEIDESDIKITEDSDGITVTVAGTNDTRLYIEIFKED